MDWMSENRAEVVCSEIIVRIPLPNGEIHLIYGESSEKRLGITSCMKAQKYLSHGFRAFLVEVIEKKPKEKKIDEIPVVRDYPEVFLDDLLGLPPSRQVEFQIDLIPGATPIAKSPYRLAPSEMKELSDQLQELLDKGFIRLSFSPWGAPILFVKKKDGSMRMCRLPRVK
ncbi:uncharacterized protein LOC143552280 [Bidens hawaiensis]|uniref:uncharacterized protein LOC143552280 n=1 Tax=Bidens hawaiensis TaxID=980011 RepID=UPI00404A642A